MTFIDPKEQLTSELNRALSHVAKLRRALGALDRAERRTPKRRDRGILDAALLDFGLQQSDPFHVSDAIGHLVSAGHMEQPNGEIEDRRIRHYVIGRLRSCGFTTVGQGYARRWLAPNRGTV